MIPGSTPTTSKNLSSPVGSRIQLLVQTDNANLFHQSGGKLTGGIAVNSSGKIYFGNSINIGSVNIDGNVDAQQWLCDRTGSIDGPADMACFANVGLICTDSEDNLYIADAGLIRKSTPDFTVSTIADLHQDHGYDQRPLVEICGLATDKLDNVHFCVAIFAYEGRTDQYKISERSIVSMTADGVVTNLIDLPQIDNPGAIRVDAEQNIYLVDSARILKIHADEHISVYADLGMHSMPADIVLESDGTLYVSDVEQHNVRRILPDCTVSVVAELDMPGPMALLGCGRLAVIAKGGIYTIDTQ